jgi:hypothetical protein
MRTISTFIFITAALCMGATKNQTLGTGSYTYGRIKVQYVMVAEPALKDSQYGFGGASSANLLHRWVSDKSTHSYFGYDLIVEPIAGTTQCRVSILPLSLTTADLTKQYHSDIDAGWKPLLLPHYPVPQLVEPGDTIALDLLVSADGTQKVVDYLKASCQTESSVAADPGPARDFTLDDVILNIDNGSLYINGDMPSGTPTVIEANGTIVWFSVPGKGRFLVSAVPRAGFVKAGNISRNHLKFEVAGDRYEVRASHPILSERNAFNAYVMVDPNYQGRDAVTFGSAHTVEKALSQK